MDEFAVNYSFKAIEVKDENVNAIFDARQELLEAACTGGNLHGKSL